MDDSTEKTKNYRKGAKSKAQRARHKEQGAKSKAQRTPRNSRASYLFFANQLVQMNIPHALGQKPLRPLRLGGEDDLFSGESWIKSRSA